MRRGHKTIRDKILERLAVGPATLREIASESGIRMGSVGVEIQATSTLGYVIGVGMRGNARIWGINPEAKLPGAWMPGRRIGRKSGRVVNLPSPVVMEKMAPLVVAPAAPVVLTADMFECSGRCEIPASARVVDSFWQMLWRNERYWP